LILLDLNMPRMDGVELLKELRKDEDLKKSTVFIMTTAARSNACDWRVIRDYVDPQRRHSAEKPPFAIREWRLSDLPPRT
jgi:CheY-like chemotaxis protein